jgi:hypothetical protein
MTGSKSHLLVSGTNGYRWTLGTAIFASAAFVCLLSSLSSSNGEILPTLRALLSTSAVDDPEPLKVGPHHAIVHHKDLFPLNTQDYVGTILVSLGSMIAASGGIGGGGILVPILILVYGFHPKYAIPLSNFTIVGSSITNMALNLQKRHPDADR